jgi:hypothetical protein
LWSETKYQTQALLCLYNIIFTVVIVITEFSPKLLEDLLIEFFPFLGTIMGKAAFYAIIGTFCIDSEFKFVGRIGGYLCFVIATLWVAYDFVYYRNPRNKVQTGFKGYYTNKNNIAEDDLPGNKSHISEYSLQSIKEEDANQNQEYQPPKIETNEP